MLPPPLPPPLVEEPDARVQHVPETVLQDLWHHLRFSTAGLQTTTGERVEILTPGRLNRHAGPDFTDARIRLTPVEGPPLVFAGDVEVHRTSGEWLVHRHDTDARYDRVVLHVTLVDDRHTGRLLRADGTTLPEVVLYPHLDRPLRSLLYSFFARPRASFPCETSWPTVTPELRRAWVRRLGAVRLGVRASRLAEDPDQDRSLVTAVFRALGFAPNADSMEELARRLEFDLLRDLPEAADMEAVLLATAGLLPEGASLRHTDPEGAAYAEALSDRIDALGVPIRPMTPTAWTFFRLRPSNFPTRRLAQAAALLAGGGPLHDRPLDHFRAALDDPKPLRALRLLLTTPRPAPFWQDHVRFGAVTKPSDAGIGKDRADRILTDAVLPALLLDARIRRDRPLSARVLDVFGHLPPALDSVVRPYYTADFEPTDARETQGLHALARGYCATSRCLRCAVGKHLLGTDGRPNSYAQPDPAPGVG